MNSEKKEFVVSTKNILQSEVYMPSVLAESNGDYVLPDYMPKVQKILRIEARATPPAKFIGSKDAKLSGNVLCSLVYLGEDGEIGATVLPSKYEFTVPFDKNGAPQMLSTFVDVDTLNYRLSGPRKLNIRTRLRAKYHAFFNADASPIELSDDPSKVFKLYGETDSVNTVMLGTNEISLSDSIPIECGEDSHLLWCGANAGVSDVKAVDGGVSIRGEVVSKVLLDDGGEMKCFSKKIPFEEFIEGEVSRGAGVYAFASVVSTEASKENGNEAFSDVIISLEALVDTPCKIPILKDTFSSDGEGSVETKELVNRATVSSRNGIYDVGASVPASGIAAVIDASGSVFVDEIVCKEGELVASGRCLLNCICVGEENTTVSNEYTVPFKIAQSGEYAPSMAAYANGTLLNVRTRIDEKNITFDMDIALCTRAEKNENLTVVEKYDFSSAKPYKENKYPLCVVYSNGESLWSLAKKHHVSPQRLAQINQLDIDEADMLKTEKVAQRRSLMLELN